MNYTSAQNFAIFSIDYQLDLAQSLFSSIESTPWSMLLRSVSPAHPDNRFDILVTNPVATIETRGQESQVEYQGKVEISREDPFTLLDIWQKKLLGELEPIADIPFLGGALGYFSYDLGRCVEKIPAIAQQDLGAPDMAVGIYDWAIIADHQLKKAYAVGVNAQENYQNLLAQTCPAKPAFALTTAWASNMDKAQYASRFEKVQAYLQSGDCYQINLAQRFSAEYQGSEWLAYNKLEQANGAPFSAFIRTTDNAILSVSPERFLELKGDLIETKPIKGTRPRNLEDKSADELLAQELKTTDKDQAENLMIVDLLRNDIGRVAKPGSVHVPHLFEVESFPAVHHLVSTIRAKLDSQYSATDLLRACFPGGSITGAPKVRAMEIIEELEPHRRSAYCGSIGYISRCGQMDSSITIRTLITDKGKIHAWAGGGLVADSQVDAEYQETLDKLSRILPTLEK
ncbi:aminodeoxychorismate synthase component I [Vibrio sp. SCSIO 43136]|uniref:aminodeoxychorismate synthase component I n=1 Tax=Vibrio sp. SCSIO 43136 TaxID=2819101 RepID=UPI00207569C4|nr:aminodeoxychorismate synthase component I [Vibrio sp. SCSIO 43136]USD66438.1 aminodeoxychorismate synthase component I [Vibrio sp. SCSIO 43136]